MRRDRYDDPGGENLTSRQSTIETVIGLTGSAGTQNFVILHPRKGEYAGVRFRIPFDEALDRDIDESSLEKLPYKHNRFRVRIRKPDLDDSRAVIKRLICQAHEHYIAGE